MQNDGYDDDKNNNIPILNSDLSDHKKLSLIRLRY